MSNNQTRIRQASKEDKDTLLKVKPDLTEDIVSDRLDRQEKNEVDYLVLEKDGVIVSYVLLKWVGRKTHPEYPDMEDLYTKKEERGKGYATKLIKECEKRAKEKGFKKIGLAVNPQINNYARKFYEKLGYKHDGGKSYVDAVYNGVEDWVIDLEKELLS